MPEHQPRNRFLIFLIALGVAVIAATACDDLPSFAQEPQTPRVIYVTPTPDGAVAELPPASPTRAAPSAEDVGSSATPTMPR